MAPERVSQSQRDLRAKLIRATVIRHLIDGDHLSQALKCPGPNDYWAVVNANSELSIESGDDLTQLAIDSGWDPEA